MTLEQYITRWRRFPPSLDREFQRGWNTVQKDLGAADRMAYPHNTTVLIKRDYHTMQKGMWAPWGSLWMAPDCWKRNPWKPSHSYGLGANIHEIAHIAQWRKLGAVSWMWNLAWASVLQVTGRTWHSAGFERQAIRIQNAVRDAINADPKWNHRLRVEVGALLERDDF